MVPAIQSWVKREVACYFFGRRIADPLVAVQQAHRLPKEGVVFADGFAMPAKGNAVGTFGEWSLASIAKRHWSPPRVRALRDSERCTCNAVAASVAARDQVSSKGVSSGGFKSASRRKPLSTFSFQRFTFAAEVAFATSALHFDPHRKWYAIHENQPPSVWPCCSNQDRAASRCWRVELWPQLFNHKKCRVNWADCTGSHSIASSRLPSAQ